MFSHYYGLGFSSLAIAESSSSTWPFEYLRYIDVSSNNGLVETVCTVLICAYASSDNTCTFVYVLSPAILIYSSIGKRSIPFCWSTIYGSPPNDAKTTKCPIDSLPKYKIKQSKKHTIDLFKIISHKDYKKNVKYN